MANPEELGAHPLLVQALEKLRADEAAKLPKDKTTTTAAAAAASKVDPPALTAAIAANLPNVVALDGLFLGYIDRAGEKWLLLYRDLRLQEWILVPDSAREGFERNADARRKVIPDTVWVKHDAPVVVGRGAHTVERMFLLGSSTTAGDLDRTLGSRGRRDLGIFSPDSPPLCGCGSKTP